MCFEVRPSLSMDRAMRWCSKSEILHKFRTICISFHIIHTRHSATVHHSKSKRYDWRHRSARDRRPRTVRHSSLHLTITELAFAQCRGIHVVHGSASGVACPLNMDGANDCGKYASACAARPRVPGVGRCTWVLFDPVRCPHSLSLMSHVLLREKRRIRQRWDDEWGSIAKEGNIWWLGSGMKGWVDVMGSNRWGWIFPIGRSQSNGLTYPVNPCFDDQGRWRRRIDWPPELR